MLGNFAIADAFGMGAEFVSGAHVEAMMAVDRYYDNPNNPRYEAGRYTDDTEMTRAVVRIITASPDKVPDRRTIIEAFIEEFKAGKHVDAYSKRFQKLLEEIAYLPDAVDQFEARVISSSTRNGGMMRTLPVGFIEDKQLAIEYAIALSSVTHADPLPAVLITLAVRKIREETCIGYVDDFLNDCLEDLSEELAESLRENLHHIAIAGWRTMPCPCDGMHTAILVLQLVSQHENSQVVQFEDVMRSVLEIGGDTDTVAALTLGMLSINRDVYFPEWTHSGLEQNFPRNKVDIIDAEWQNFLEVIVSVDHLDDDLSSIWIR